MLYFRACFSFCFLVLLLSACANTEEAELGAYKLRVSELEMRLENDSLFLQDMESQLLSIDEGLNEIVHFTKLAGKGQISQRDFRARVAVIDKLVRENDEKIQVLEARVEQSNISVQLNKSLSRNLEERKKQIAEQAEEILVLKTEIESLTKENQALREGKDSLESKVQNKDQEIQSIYKQVQDAEENLRRLKESISRAEGRAEEVEVQINKQYLKMGIELLEIAKDVKGVFGSAKVTREECAQRAFDYLCLAHQKGEYSALGYLDELKKHRKLSKFVRAKTCVLEKKQ